MKLSAIDVTGATASPLNREVAVPRGQITREPSLLVQRVIWTTLAVGVALRLWQYLLNRSLWLDEAYLTLNLTHRSFAGLMKPLDFDQGAPVGFLWLEKSVLRAFGNSEYALRLLPLLAGVASLFLFYKLAKSILPATAVAVALGLFALSPSLIYYSSEVKQYSLDVAITILLYWFALRGSRERWSDFRIGLFGLLGAVAIWLSHPATFVLAAIAITFIVVLAARKDWARLARLAPALLVWGLSLVFCYFLSLRSLNHNHDLLAYWQSEFMPLPPHSVSDLKWFVDTFFDFFVEAAGLQFKALAGFAFVVGGARLLHDQGERLGLLLGPGFLTLVASGLHKYPFGGRLMLFLVPAVLLLIAQGAEEVRVATWQRSPLIACALIGLLLLDPAMFAVRHLAEPRVETDHPGVMNPEEIKPVLAYIRDHRQANDFLYLFYASQPAFQYYSELHPQARPNLILGTASGDDPQSYTADLDRLRGKRVWVVFSHIHGVGKRESAYIRFYLDLLGPRIASFQSPGAVTYLYDLTQAPALSASATTGKAAAAVK
jgi:hypothetical protein